MLKKDKSNKRTKINKEKVSYDIWYKAENLKRENLELMQKIKEDYGIEIIDPFEKDSDKFYMLYVKNKFLKSIIEKEEELGSFSREKRWHMLLRREY